MKYFYGKENGKIVKLGKIYTQSEHNISNNVIPKKILNIIQTLIQKKHHAYIVGGAVRDLLLEKSPKDFDIVTDASPKLIKKYFRRSQLVGKRFPIVLVPLYHNTFIEISTFRADTKTQSQTSPLVEDTTIYGTIVEDVTRRDFTCNALYYCPMKKEIIDFVNGVTHIQRKKLVAIYKEFKEDPVRILRAIKYASKCTLHMSLWMRLQIYIHTPLLKTVSHSRIGDEILKILVSGVSNTIIKQCFQYRLLKYMLPSVYQWYSNNKTAYTLLLENLAHADMQIDKPYNRIRGLQMLMQPYVVHILPSIHTSIHNHHTKKISRQNINIIMTQVKEWLFPITPPNNEVYNAILLILQSLGLTSYTLRSQSRIKSPKKSSTPKRRSRSKRDKTLRQ